MTEPTSRVLVANAPVSFGAFEVTVGRNPDVPRGTDVLDAVARAGYDGIDLGPVGYLGAPAELTPRLARRGLRLSGGYVALPFSQPALMPAAMTELNAVLDIFEATGLSDDDPLPPRATLADAGSDARRAAPGRAQRDRSLGLGQEGWARLASGIDQAADLCRRRGYEPTFHHHAGTYVEAPWEIEELLRRSDVGLCLDTGHLLLGGGDPVRAVQMWGDRIDHVHLKDVRLSVVDAVVREGAPMMEVWRRRAFCALGDGDLQVDAVLDGLRVRRYVGWLVVEQDTIPGPGDPADRAANDQVRNRAFLRARGI